MGRPLPNPPPGFDDLPVAEQIDYVQALWDRIAAHEDRVPVPAWHAEELDRRMTDYAATPELGRPWEEVEAELRARVPGKR
jgi:putative addiction module component (TIGR02574 family)